MDSGATPSLARRFQSAPPPLRQSLVACTLILVPAALGAIFGWPRYLTYALLVPGFAIQIGLGWAAGQARGARYRVERPSLGPRLLVGGFCGFLGALVAGVETAYAPLLFALLLIVVAEPLWRVVWKRQRETAQ
jgi:hypothetical protein